MPDAENDKLPHPANSSDDQELTGAIPAVYELETLEQLRAIADELRTRIVDTLTQRAMTVTQLAETLGEAPAKVHYHVRELQRVGLLRLVATREKSGILEKYYRAVAQSLQARKTLFSSAPTDETLATVRFMLDTASSGFMRALEYTVQNQLWENPKMWGLSSSQIWVTRDELQALTERIQQEFNKYETPRGIEGEVEHTIVLMGYDPHVPDSSQPTSTTPPTAPAEEPMQSQKPRLRRYVSIGATTLDRGLFEDAMTQNRPLDMTILGICLISDSVPADLVDRAVVRFRHRGILTASPEVREVLKRKEKQEKQ